MMTPAEWNHSATSADSAAEPEMKKRTRPPKRSRTFENTSLSAMPCWIRRPVGTGLPERTRRERSRPTFSAQRKSLSLAPPSSSIMPTTRP